MILHTSCLRGLANQSVRGDSAITGPNDILGHRVRRCPVRGDKSGIGSRLVATTDRVPKLLRKLTPDMQADRRIWAISNERVSVP